jgi:pectin methylesterase-like acyl-CoA thioesterase
VVVAADGSGEFHSVQQAIDALPPGGGTIRIRPGTYREVVTVAKPHIRLEGSKKDPSRVLIVFNRSHATAGGTLKSATVTVLENDFFAEGVTFANDYGIGRPLAPEGSQAVALAVRGDRAVLRNVRLLGAQDTLYTGSKSCASEQGPCLTARQYFSHCYIEGNIDFIFGDGKTVFDHCEIHAIAHDIVFLTAQSKHYPEQESGYVFDRCRVTAAPGTGQIFLGRPWRPYSTVFFLRSDLDATIDPAGWREWRPGETHSLNTARYGEFQSKGKGADPAHRDGHARQLTAEQAKRYLVHEFLSGKDGWNPDAVR